VQLLLDTGPFTMILMDSPRLKQDVRQRIAEANTLSVSAVSFYEIGQMTRLGKWDEVADLVPELEAFAHASGIEIVPLTAKASLRASQFDWHHCDPFDRMIAAVALQEGCPVVSPDAAFDGVGVERVW
jgi:PIN domain nuclease of toxin-antitoxin system